MSGDYVMSVAVLGQRQCHHYKDMCLHDGQESSCESPWTDDGILRAGLREVCESLYTQQGPFFKSAMLTTPQANFL